MMREAMYRSLFFFLLAGICEIGGGYMIWKAVKHEQPIWVGLLGCIVMAAYGVVATFQPAGFGRTYATYGGIFVIMSLLWGWVAEKAKPDLYDIIGGLVVLAGTAIIFYAPRK
ncbi:MAG: YnfA family protein [Flavipsychrobacter sp.]|nr:YnfA family protein [Flavipsychrobacter sp.]